MRRTWSADVRQLDEQTCVCAQVSDAEDRKSLGQEFFSEQAALKRQ